MRTDKFWPVIPQLSLLQKGKTTQKTEHKKLSKNSSINNVATPNVDVSRLFVSKSDLYIRTRRAVIEF